MAYEGLNGDKRLFVDMADVESRENVERVFHQALRLQRQQTRTSG